MIWASFKLEHGVSVVVKIAEPGTSESLMQGKELEVNSHGNVKS